MKKFRVKNTTHKKHPPFGYFLDHESKLFGADKSIVIDAPDEVLPDTIQKWADEGLVSVADMTSGEIINGEAQSIVTAGTRVNEASGQEYDDGDELGFDPELAKEATLPNGAHMPSIQQMPAAKARVTLGTETENHGNTDSLSPIPGDRPRSVDDSDQFTIRAPRSQQVGAVVK